MNVDDEHEENNGTPNINVGSLSVQINTSSKNNSSRFNKQEPPTEYDYTLMDELFGLLDQEDSEIQPISCGYFNKIVQAFLGKIK